MRHVFSLFVCFLAAVSAFAGVRPVTGRASASADGPVAASESAALFAGISRFPYDPTLAAVPYAVDDAVDLAYAFSVAATPRLVDPRRVVLALSGEPQKPESKQRRDTLVAAGATLSSAGQSDLLSALTRQAQSVGPNGVLIAAFATHGVSEEGQQILFAETSMLQHRETGITEAKVRELVSQANVPRSLILIDACRQRLTRNQRAGEADPRSAAAMLRELANMNGQAVLSAAAPGEYAYDDETRRNGVFTAAVIDALQCAAAPDSRGFITVDTLYAFVEERVLAWVQKHRDPGAKRATQLSCEGKTKGMPLAMCGSAH